MLSIHPRYTPLFSMTECCTLLCYIVKTRIGKGSFDATSAVVQRLRKCRSRHPPIYSSIPGPGPACLPICLAFSISSQRRRFDAMPELDAIAFLSTRNESYTPSRTGSMDSPVLRSRPTMLPSACSSWRVATKVC